MGPISIPMRTALFPTGSGLRTFVSGNLQLGGKVPGLDDIRIAAIGGLGAFVLIYLLWK